MTKRQAEVVARINARKESESTEIKCPMCCETHVIFKNKFPVLCCDLRSKGKGCSEPLPTEVRDIYLTMKQNKE